MSKHTPGPWHTAGDQGVQIRNQRDQIAKVWTMRGDEWKANARLIAMSPEMFEVLQVIAGDGLSMYGSPTDMLEKFQDMARTVVAKVTGEKE